MQQPIAGALIALALAAATLPAPAAIVYVDKNSPGPTHDGRSWQTAYTTVLVGYAGANAGDEVWVGPGAYTEAITLKPNVSLYGGFIGFELFRDMRLGIQGITKLMFSTSGTGVIISATGNVITESTVIDGFTFMQDPRGAFTGVAIRCDSASPTISHNVFTGMQLTPAGIISCTNAKAAIRDNTITACSSTGEVIYPVILLKGATGVIANNTIVGNSGYAMSGSSSALIVNNIVAYNLGKLNLSSYGKPPTYRNNCLFENFPLIGTQFAGTDPSGANGNFTADPRFAVYAYGNLHLAADSPCRDAGDDSVVAAGETDIDLQPRIQGAHVDIGADESDGRTWTYSPHIVRVSPTGKDSNDGSSWALAKKSIQAGIDLAASIGGDVWVQSGTYTLLTSVKTMIVLPPYCYLYGGFAGTETALDQRDWLATPTIITASKTPILGASGGYRVSAVDGFVLMGGGITTSNGAGITCSGASPYIRNNVFTRNTGAAVQCRFSSPVLTNNAFYNNSLVYPSYVVGGLSSFLTVVGNVFSGNAASTNSQVYGSVYGDKGSTLLVTNNLFDSNNAGSSGGYSAVSGVQGTGIIANNTFVNNRGIAISPNGGIVANNIVAFNDTGIWSIPLTKVLSNCVYGNGANYSETDRSGKDNNISVYPMFNSLLKGDYRLLDTSACVDAGRDEYVSAGDIDLDGMPRIQGRHVDLGCFESSATSMIAHWSDIARLLRIAGGLTPATPVDASILNKATGDATLLLDLRDAQSLIRQLSAQRR
ncbi:MAG TPA: right-handed parallel beta-helix repeat-containing protein [Armatimonadota bacterium]|jgi:hypothetical protein